MKELRYKGDTIAVYEFEDAHGLIFELAAEYKDDYSIITRGRGKNRRRVAYYHYPCAFDIETTTIVPGQMGYKGGPEAPPVAFPYLFQFCVYGRVIFCRTYTEAMQVFDWLAEAFRCDEYTHVIIFDHNLGYEWAFFRDSWEILPDECFALDEHHPVTIQLQNGLLLRDSYKMTNMSLQTLTKDWSRKWKKEPEIMDYNKIRTPYDDLDNDTMVYSALDVLSLSDAIDGFLRARGEEIWTKCPTSTSFIRARLKDRVGVTAQKRTPEQRQYLNLIQNMRINAEQYQLIKELARGGNTHANRAYTGRELSDLYHGDIRSSYPAQMVCYPEYPLTGFADLGDIEADELLQVQGNYCTMARLCLKRPRLRRDRDVTVPYIATSICQALKGSANYSDNGRYIDGADELVISIFGIELQIIIDQYDFDDIIVLEAYAAHKGYLPDIIRNFVLELYQDKTELKGVEGSEAEYALSKTYINGVYGMAYTDPIRQSFVFEDGDIVPGEPKDLTEELERYQDSVSYFLPYVWGAMVACLGRMYLQKMIDAVGSSFVYADTDSVFALHHRESARKMEVLERGIVAYQEQCGLNLKYYDTKGRLQELGSIDRETHVEKFKTFGAKKYVTVENGKLQCTIAGVPKKTGAQVIGDIKNFRLGMCFYGRETGKQTIWYNPAQDLNLHDDQGRPIDCRSNAAMLPCNYLLGISEDYRTALFYENIDGWRWDYEELSEG